MQMKAGLLPLPLAQNVVLKVCPNPIIEQGKVSDYAEEVTPLINRAQAEFWLRQVKHDMWPDPIAAIGMANDAWEAAILHLQEKPYEMPRRIRNMVRKLQDLHLHIYQTDKLQFTNRQASLRGEVLKMVREEVMIVYGLDKTETEDIRAKNQEIIVDLLQNNKWIFQVRIDAAMSHMDSANYLINVSTLMPKLVLSRGIVKCPLCNK